MSGRTEHQIFYRRLLRKRPHIGIFNPDVALRIIGRRDEIHPSDVVATVYPTRNDARLHSRANREAYGHEPATAGVLVEGVGWLYVADIRLSLRAMGGGVTDPATPWPGWHYPGVWHRTGNRLMGGVSAAPAPAAGPRSPPTTGPADADDTPHTAPPPDPTDPTDE